MSTHPIALVVRPIALGLAFALVSCGGGGNVPGPSISPRALPADYFTRKAVCYEAYRSYNPSTETVTDAEVSQDLSLLAEGDFRLLRLYNSDAQSAQILRLIQAGGLDIKVQLGVWINSEKYATPAQVPGIEANNQTNIATAIAQANAYPGIVEAVSVGNECLVSWTDHPVSPAQLAGYIAQVRSAIAQPVTTDDNYVPYAAAPAEILNAIDFASIHTYTLLDSLHPGLVPGWQQTGVAPSSRAAVMMATFLADTEQQFGQVQSYLSALGYTYPIVIGETGWKAIASNSEVYRASPVNQQMFYSGLGEWLAAGAGPRNIFWFEAFDEPYKGSDDNWGLFNVSRQARYAVKDLYPASQWEPGTSGYTAASAVYFVPTVQNPTVTADRYTLYDENVTAGEARPAAAPPWQAWGSVASAAEVTTSAPAGDTRSMKITPTPASWGWGMAMAYNNVADDLSGFAGGSLNFSVQTTYPGLIQVGFGTGDVADLTSYNNIMPIGPGDYGYMNDGAWHNVSIPISAIAPWGSEASAMQANQDNAQLNLAQVTSPFLIVDIFGSTGKTTSTGTGTPIYVDNIYWSK